MLVMRPTTSTDQDAVAAMILARCEWMERNGLPSWRPSVDDLAGQCGNPFGDVWVMEMNGSRIVGRTTIQQEGPPWGWTDTERAEPALYLNTTVTDPAYRHMRLGTLIAWWAVDQAAGQGVQWVRRDCLWPQLATYYASQGFSLVRTAENGKYTHHMLARRAEPMDLAEQFRTGMLEPLDVGR
nr:GNAT family N-acetyltransferase [Streptosporangium minutum]